MIHTCTSYSYECLYTSMFSQEPLLDRITDGMYMYMMVHYIRIFNSALEQAFH